MLRTICFAAMAALFFASAYADEQGAQAGGAQPGTVKVLRTTNKAQTNEFVCAALEFKNVNPFDIVNFFWAVTSREEGGCYSFAHPEEERGYIVVICPRYQLESLKKLARDLDRPKLNSAPGSKYIYYRMKHRNATDPGFLDALSQSFAGVSGIVVPDLETNSVLLFDAPGGAKSMEDELLSEMDKPLTQVEMGVKIYEIEVKNDGALGLDFEDWKNGPGKNFWQYARVSSHLKFKGSENFHAHQDDGGIFLDYPSAFFDFLVEKGKAHSLVNTKVAAISNVPVLLTTGEQYLHYAIVNGENDRELQAKLLDTGNEFNLATDGLTFPTNGREIVFNDKPVPYGIREPFTSKDSPALRNYPYNKFSMNSTVEAVDTGVSFLVVPTVGEKMINMSLDLKVVGVNGFDGAGAPILNSRQAADSLAVADGDEVIFGGLTRDRKIEQTQKVPILGSLPVIGYLFGREVNSTQKTVVAAAISPRLIQNSDNITEKDKTLVRQAKGEEVVVLPKSEYCFEQSMEHLY